MKHIKTLIGYIVGFSIINLAFPEKLDIKQFILVTLGGCLLILTTHLFHLEK